jgi:hypothetical protein
MYRKGRAAAANDRSLPFLFLSTEGVAMPRGTRSSRPAIFSLAVALCFLLSACGLPTYVYLYPPTEFSSPGSGLLSIVNNSNNYDSSEVADQSFAGYEGYYRGYSDQATAISMARTLQSKASTYSEDPDSFFSYATNTVNFVRVRSINSGDTTPNDTQPLIEILASEASIDNSYLIYLNSNSDWLLRKSDGTTSLSLCRSIAENSRFSFYKKSNYLSSSSDGDYVGDDSPSTVYFVFFAVAYGTDPDSPGVSIYSSPVFPTGTGVSDGVLAYSPES